MRHLYRFVNIVLLVTALVACKDDGAIKDNMGNSYRLDASNHKWVLVNVWATWCPPCIAEMPEFNAFYQKHKDKFILLGANFDNLRGDKLNKAIKRFQIKFPLLQGNYVEVFKVPPVESVPTTFLFDPQGKLVKTFYLPQTLASLEAELSSVGAPEGTA